ncbi:MAG: hypothetical protein PHH71_03225 [Clostridia bacterium]|jgi:hypothetical protein|nr:hypothetical protein [Clostridia bacterium]MDD3232058.1 hypothetical protein [Clostridia bacterium]MDD3862925.1 hypothetical protein [Clostridia bacterium]MDD4408266.1 hypothetical protein [Clostridia bacterium]
MEKEREYYIEELKKAENERNQEKNIKAVSLGLSTLIAVGATAGAIVAPHPALSAVLALTAVGSGYAAIKFYGLYKEMAEKSGYEYALENILKVYEKPAEKPTRASYEKGLER